MSAEHPSLRRSQARRLRALVRKEFRQLLRDRSNIAIGVVLPILLILLFGYGMSLDVRNAPVAVVLEDASPTAREVVAGLEGSRYLDTRRTVSMADAEALMHDRQVDAILRVPSDFSTRLALGDAHLQLLLHGIDATSASAIQQYVLGAVGQWGQIAIDRGGAASPGGIAVETRLWFNAANSSTWYLVPGLIVIIVTLVGAFLTALVVAREWERGTLEALFVTPVHSGEILLAKLVPYFFVGMLGLALCLLAAHFLFHVPMQGSLSVLVLVSMLYLFVALGLGLLISSVTRNQFLASQLALLSSFLPALMLSGFLFDLRNVPTVVRAVSAVIPATYYMELTRTLYLVGNDWSLILKNGAILAFDAALLLAAARYVTRKSLDT